MHPNPALVTAANDQVRMLAAQHVGRVAATAWRGRRDVADLAAVLAGFAARPPASAAAMALVLQPWLEDKAWLNAFVTEMVAAMHTDPLAALQFRMAQGRVTHGLVLLQSPGVEMTLTWVDAMKLPHARDRHVLLSAGFALLHVIDSGGLRITHHRLAEDAHLLTAEPPLELANGETLAIDCDREAVRMLDARTDAVLLRVNLTLPARGDQVAFDAETGVMLAHALGDDATSRMLPLLAVARLAGYAPRAATTLAELADDPDPRLRWAAMREWLVADTSAALPALHTMAERDCDGGIRKIAAQSAAFIAHRERRACPA
jgi:hypothetical protein